MKDNFEPKIDMHLWSNKARNLSPYVPGEQPQGGDFCKLNTNENPYPPSPKVAEAIAQALLGQGEQLRLYPSAESDTLRQALAALHNLAADQVFMGNGSDEVLAFIFLCFFAKERPLLTPDISYSFYPIYGETFDVDLVKIALRSDFSIEPNDYRQPCSGIIIANPNAPTGILLSLAAIAKLAGEHPNAVIVIDEAYIDFAQTPDAQPVSAISLINEFSNILVTQTFSKSRSLAGLRVGMAFGNASLIEALTRMKNSFNSYPLDRLAQAGAIASVADTPYFAQTCQKVIQLREQLTNELVKLEFDVLPSQANFVFARPKHGNASEMAAALREQGILVRYFDKPRLNEYLRITVGNAKQMKRLIVALRGLGRVEFK